MSNVDINVDRRTDGLTDGRTDGRTENRTPISHPATSRCDKNPHSFKGGLPDLAGYIVRRVNIYDTVHSKTPTIFRPFSKPYPKQYHNQVYISF